MGGRRRLVDKRLYVRSPTHGLKLVLAQKLVCEGQRVERLGRAGHRDHLAVYGPVARIEKSLGNDARRLADVHNAFFAARRVEQDRAEHGPFRLDVVRGCLHVVHEGNYSIWPNGRGIVDVDRCLTDIYRLPTGGGEPDLPRIPAMAAAAAHIWPGVWALMMATRSRAAPCATVG